MAHLCHALMVMMTHLELNVLIPFILLDRRIDCPFIDWLDSDRLDSHMSSAGQSGQRLNARMQEGSDRKSAR